jgi:hypothetical protein
MTRDRVYTREYHTIRCDRHTASARNVYTELGDQWAFSMAFRLKWAYVCSVATR